MARAALTPARITVDDALVREISSLSLPPGSRLTLLGADGEDLHLPEPVGDVLVRALRALSMHGQVSVAGMPEQLTSTEAADALGVSRPTLMKWMSQGRIAGTKVGTHTRFARHEVLRLREERRAERIRAFEALREAEPLE